MEKTCTKEVELWLKKIQEEVSFFLYIMHYSKFNFFFFFLFLVDQNFKVLPFAEIK